MAIVKGPVSQIVIDPASTFDTVGKVTLTADHIISEGVQMPTEEEAVVAVLSGENDQTGVMLKCAFPVKLDDTASPAAGVDAWIDAQTRVYVQITTRAGVVVVLGATTGMRVRKTGNLDLGYGKYPVEMYIFEATFAAAGDGYSIT